MFVHVTIAVNRVWAITFPVSYRRIHSKKVAVLMCVVAYAYVNLILLPDLIPKALRLKPLLDLYTCMAQLKSNGIQLFGIQAVAILIVLFAYPYIAYKKWQIRRNKQNLVGPAMRLNNKRNQSKNQEVSSQSRAMRLELMHR